MRASLWSAIVVLLALGLGACAGPTPAPPSSPPTSATPTPTPTASEPAARTMVVDVYFAHTQPTELTLISEPHTISLDDDTLALDVVLGALLDGTLQPRDADYASLWGGGSELLSTQRSGDTVTIDLHVGQLDVGAASESIAIAQVVWTARAVDPSIEKVRLTVDGADADTLAGHVDITEPLVAEPPENILSPLQITAPAYAATVMSPVVSAGVACVFEASFAWRLDGPDGVVAEGSAMAAEACPARGAWTLDLGELAAGAYELTVIEYSAQDGSVASTDSKPFTVAGSE